MNHLDDTSANAEGTSSEMGSTETAVGRIAQDENAIAIPPQVDPDARRMIDDLSDRIERLSRPIQAHLLLKEIFCKLLDWRYVNEPMPHSVLPASARESVFEASIVAKCDHMPLCYIRLAQSELTAVAQRKAVYRVLRGWPTVLIAVGNFAENELDFCWKTLDASTADTGRTYQQLFHVSADGDVISRDLRRVLGLLACRPEEPSVRIPKTLNECVMQIRRLFAEEVKHRESELAHSMTLGQSQKYVLCELRTMFAATEDDSTKGQINILEQVFRHPLTDAVRRELNNLRRNHATATRLLEGLKQIYQRHGLGRWLTVSQSESARSVSRVVCSEALSVRWATSRFI